jgi:hypothetical protein
MNKLWLTSLLLLSLSIVKGQNLSIGVTAGFGHSWTNLEPKNFHPAYNIGAKVVYSFQSNWGVSGDLKFSSEGATVGPDGDENVLRFNYIRVPLQAIYFFGKYGDRIRPKVSIGPSIGIFAGGKTKSYQNDEVISEGSSSDIVKGFDFGATFGGGLNMRIAPATWLNADLSYYLGLANVVETTGDIKNRNIGINIGVTFPLATLRPEKVTKP